MSSPGLAQSTRECPFLPIHDPGAKRQVKKIIVALTFASLQCRRYRAQAETLLQPTPTLGAVSESASFHSQAMG